MPVAQLMYQYIRDFVSGWICPQGDPSLNIEELANSTLVGAELIPSVETSDWDSLISQKYGSSWLDHKPSLISSRDYFNILRVCISTKDNSLYDDLTKYHYALKFFIRDGSLGLNYHDYLNLREPINYERYEQTFGKIGNHDLVKADETIMAFLKALFPPDYDLPFLHLEVNGRPNPLYGILNMKLIYRLVDSHLYRQKCYLGIYNKMEHFTASSAMRIHLRPILQAIIRIQASQPGPWVADTYPSYASFGRSSLLAIDQPSRYLVSMKTATMFNPNWFDAWELSEILCAGVRPITSEEFLTRLAQLN